MAGIEKICEYDRCGHYPTELYDDSDIGIYVNNIQVCPDHRRELVKLFKGKRHQIMLVPDEFRGVDFYLFVQGVPCHHQKDGLWMRWFTHKRKWKRNMRKLLGVRRLNIVKQIKI